MTILFTRHPTNTSMHISGIPRSMKIIFCTNSSTICPRRHRCATSYITTHLHAFQASKFYDAIFRASKIFGYQVTLQLNEYRKLYEIGRIRKDVLERVVRSKKGKADAQTWINKLLSSNYDTSNTPRIGSLRAQWKTAVKLDLDTLVQPLLFRILCSYLDQGIAIWKFPSDQHGFLSSIINLEKNSFTSFFKTKSARNLLLNGNYDIKDLLKRITGDESLFAQYLFDQQFSHHGWSGIVNSVEDQPGSLLDRRNITLRDVIIFELLLEIDALNDKLGENWKPLNAYVEKSGEDIFAPVPDNELAEVFMLWQDAFEWSYYDDVLAGIRSARKIEPVVDLQKSFQAMFCIDERECSIRRHVEATDHCETFGTPAFFRSSFSLNLKMESSTINFARNPLLQNILLKSLMSKEKENMTCFIQIRAILCLPGFHEFRFWFSGRQYGWCKSVSAKNESRHIECFCSYEQGVGN